MEKKQIKNKEENNLENQEQTLSGFLKQKISEKNIDLSYLSENLEIKKEYLAALIENNFKNLPPDIYVRGILFKIANYFKTDGDFLWGLYKKEKKVSLNIDKPSFQKTKRVNFFRISFWFFIILIAGLMIIYQALNIILPPKIDLFTPKNDSVVNFNKIEVRGKTNANLLKINNNQVNIDNKGNFSFEVYLIPGLNIIKIDAKNKIGKEKIIERKIIYQKPETLNQETDKNKQNQTNNDKNQINKTKK